MPRFPGHILLLSISLACSARAAGVPAPGPLANANHQLQNGQADAAIATLRSIVAADQHNGPAQLLLCRAFFSEELYDDAIPACEAATAAMPTSSAAQDWLGRTYGLKADHSGPIAGLRLAPKVRDAFESAVRLDPHNAEAVGDLGEFYVSAPAMIGGGVDKAEALATQSLATSPQTAHRIRGLAAEKHEDLNRAEGEFRLAVGVAGRPAAWVDLGHYYARHKKTEQAVDALAHGVAADRSADASLMDAAEVLLNDAKVRPELAERWLKAYLEGNSLSDAAPAFRAHTDLARLAHRRGDRGTQQSEALQALALASRYEPAKKLAQ